ncbi:MAG: MarR family winged helix-turn-helix transcriptional regulator [Actinomycetota bacterium]
MSPQGKLLFGTGPDSDLEPPVRAFRILLLLAQRLRYLMDDRLRPDGMTTQQAALLTVVTALGRPSLTEAAAALGSTHQNAAQLVTALERKKLLATGPDPADRRRRLLWVTGASGEYWRQRGDGDQAAVAGWFAALSASEIELLCSLAGRLLDQLEPSGPEPVQVPGEEGN